MNVFQETQKFTQWWLWVLLISIFCIVCYGAVHQTLLNESSNESLTKNIFLILPLAIFTLIFLLFLLLRLDTRIDAEGIHVHYKPLVKRNVSWSEIKSLEVLNYGFVGGWGIRLWTSYGTVYNVKGNKGLAIELNSGKKFLIGTQKPEELQKFLEQLPQAQTLLKIE